MKSITPIAIAAAITVTGCGGSSSASNPNFFLFRTFDGAIKGEYNPAGFTAKQVKFYISQECGGKKLANYGESAQAENGVISFQGTCVGGILNKGYHEVQRMPDGRVVAEGTVGKDGNVFFTQTIY